MLARWADLPGSPQGIHPHLRNGSYLSIAIVTPFSSPSPGAMRLARSCAGRGAVGEKTDQPVLAGVRKFSARVTALDAVRESKNFRDRRWAHRGSRRMLRCSTVIARRVIPRDAGR